MKAWHPVESAPYAVELEIKAGDMAFPAILRRNASMTIDGYACDQWQATTDKYPKCWSDGCCWESNEDEQLSAQPTYWRPISEHKS